MSQSLQNQMTLAKSMNSIITLDDGAGTTITNGTINSNNITGNTITGNTLTTTNLDLNSSLTLEQYNDISITNTGGTYLVSLWEKGRSYFQQDVHANRMYSYNSLPVGVYEVANKQYVDRKTPSFATYSSNTLLPNTIDAPTMIQALYTGSYFYIVLPNVTLGQYIGREYTIYLGTPLTNDSQVISVTGRSAMQLIQRKDGTLSYLVDFNHKGVISYTFVCVSLTPSTTQACWMISNANYELENVFLNNRMANQYNENYVENNWHKLNYFDRPSAEGSAIGLAIGSIFELNGNIYADGRYILPSDLAYMASSREKITLIGNYLATNLTFLDAGLCPIDDGLPSPPTQVYLPEIIDINDFGKAFTFYLQIGTGLQVEILTTNSQQITYLNQTGLTSVFLNPTGQKTNILTFIAIKDGSTDNWFLLDNQVNIPLSNNTFSGHNYFSGEVDFQNTINANALTVSPQQLSFLNQVTLSNQIPSTAISGAGFLTETSNPNITGIFTYLTNPVFNVGGININAINANLCTTDTAQTISGAKTITGTLTANSLTITPTQLSFLNQVATNKIPVTAVNANLCTTDTTQTISGAKTITGTLTANSLTITPTQLSFLNQVATNKIPVTAVNANLCTTDTSQTISGAKIVSGVFNFTTNPTWLNSAIPITAVQDCTTQSPSIARALTGFGYLCLNAHRSTTTTGIHNTGFGTSCMQNNSSGNYNSAYGSSCAVSLDAGSNNSFFGYATASVNTGSGNSIFGANSCTTQASLTGCSLFGENNEVTSGLSNCFALGNNNSITATNAGAIGNSLTVSTVNRIQVGSGTQEVFIPGLLVINNQYAATSNTPITANITIPNLLNYQVYALKNTVNISVVLPSATSGRLSQTFLFRRVNGALTTTVITFTSSSGSVMYSTTSVTPAASFTLASGTIRTQIVCMFDGTNYGWYQII